MKEAKEAQRSSGRSGPSMEKKSIDDMKANGVEIIEVNNSAMADVVKKVCTRSTPSRCSAFIERVQAVK